LRLPRHDSHHRAPFLAVAGRSAVGMSAQAERLYRLVGVVAEVFPAAARSIREHTIEDEDAVRVRLSVDHARPLDEGFPGGRLQARGTRADPEAERYARAGTLWSVEWLCCRAGRRTRSTRGSSAARTALCSSILRVGLPRIPRESRTGSSIGRTPLQIACSLRDATRTSSGSPLATRRCSSESCVLRRASQPEIYPRSGR